MALMDRKKSSGEGGLDGYIGPGTVIEGTVRFSQVFRVDGTIRGKVISDRELVVGESGVLDADVAVGSLSVSGKLSGKIEVSQRMEIHTGAKVSGEIHMKRPSLIIEEGGIFEGRVQMGGEAHKGAEPKIETGKVAGFPAQEKARGGSIS